MNQVEVREVEEVENPETSQRSGLPHLVSEPEVQAAVPRICGRLEVVHLFFRGHGVPDLSTLLVLPDIVRFH